MTLVTSSTSSPVISLTSDREIPWSCDSCLRMSGDGDGGLGGTVVMTGAPDITEEAAMCALSWSILGLDGSSEDRREEEEFSYTAQKTAVKA